MLLNLLDLTTNMCINCSVVEPYKQVCACLQVQISTSLVGVGVPHDFYFLVNRSSFRLYICLSLSLLPFLIQNLNGAVINMISHY